jgi:tetratricopeptide (TPR) repeat protein
MNTVDKIYNKASFFFNFVKFASDYFTNDPISEAKNLLGISQDSQLNEEVIKQAFRQKAMEFHPDKYSGESPDVIESMTKLFKNINTAKDLLLSYLNRSSNESSFMDEQEKIRRQEENQRYRQQSEERQNKIKIEKLFEEGVKLISHRNYEQAIPKLKEAYEMSNKKEYLLALASAYHSNKNYQEALDAYIKYLDFVTNINEKMAVESKYILPLKEKINSMSTSTDSSPDLTGIGEEPAQVSEPEILNQPSFTVKEPSQRGGLFTPISNLNMPKIKPIDAPDLTSPPFSFNVPKAAPIDFSGTSPSTSSAPSRRPSLFDPIPGFGKKR